MDPMYEPKSGYSYESPSLRDVELGRIVKKRFEALKTERGSWDSHWKQLAEFILPRRARWLTKNPNGGAKKSASIIDATATIAFRTLASGMMMGITSPSRIWFRYVTQDRDLMEVSEVKTWLSTVQNRQMQVLQASNIYRVLHSCYEDIGVFGTAAAIILGDYDKVIRGHSLPVGTYWLATNKDGDVDTLYRTIPMTVGQVVAEFTYDACSIRVKNAYNQGNYHDDVTVVHCIEPNRSRDPHRSDFAGMPWRSIYWEEGADEGEFLAKRGYKRKPFIAPRWNVIGFDAYGQSPGMDALGDVKQLQLLQKKSLTAVDKGVDPPLQGPALTGDLRNMTKSGQYNAVPDADLQRGGIRSLYDMNFSISDTEAKIAQTQQRINQTAYADLFMMMNQMEGVQPRNEMEIAERRSEKMLGLGPVLERLQDELVEPVVDISFDECAEAELFPPPPPQLSEANLSVELQSMLAREQRGDEIIAIDRILGVTGNIAGVKPNIVDKVDFDQAIDEYSRLLGAPPSIIIPDKDVAASRQRQAQQEQAAIALEQANAGAQAAKTLSEADTQAESALAAIIGSQSGSNLA